MSRPFIPAPNCARIELIYASYALLAENVISIQKGSPYSAADLAAVRGIVDNWHNITYKSQHSPGWSLFRIRSRGMDSEASPVEDYYLPALRAGTAAGAPLPPNVTLAVKIASGLTGRSQRGRVYVIGLTASQVQANYQMVTNAYAASVVAAWNTLRTSLAAAGHTLGVLSFRTGGTWRITAQFTASTGFVLADINLDSQRRRLVGRGAT